MWRTGQLESRLQQSIIGIYNYIFAHSVYCDAAALKVEDGAVRGSVYYDAIQSVSEIDFVPLFLSGGASLKSAVASRNYP